MWSVQRGRHFQRKKRDARCFWRALATRAACGKKVTSVYGLMVWKENKQMTNSIEKKRKRIKAFEALPVYWFSNMIASHKLLRVKPMPLDSKFFFCSIDGWTLNNGQAAIKWCENKCKNFTPPTITLKHYWCCRIMGEQWTIEDAWIVFSTNYWAVVRHEKRVRAHSAFDHY